MKTLIAITLVLAATQALADGYYVYPTMPGTSLRDYSRPGYHIGPDGGYPTMPGTSLRDYRRPGYKVVHDPDGDTVYQTMPGTDLRDYSQPGLRLDDVEGDE